MTYLFDNCISPKLARMLRALGKDAWAVSEKYPANIQDIDLFAKIKGQQLVFVTTDTHQRTRKAEAIALRNSGVTALFFGPFFPKMVFWPQAAWLVSRWPKIEGFIGGVSLGTCADVSQNGKSKPFVL